MRKNLVLPLLLVAGCNFTTEPEISDRPPVLFEIEYVNYAWVPTWNGFYIDSGGTIYSYDRSKEKPLDQDSIFSHEDLMKKYEPHRTKVRELPTQPLQNVSVLIPQAASGSLSAPKYGCADAGVLSFRSYIYDASRGGFRAVLIRQEGDLAQVNLSAAAKQIYNYLDALQLMPHMQGCQP